MTPSQVGEWAFVIFLIVAVAGLLLLVAYWWVTDTLDSRREQRRREDREEFELDARRVQLKITLQEIEIIRQKAEAQEIGFRIKMAEHVRAAGLAHTTVTVEPEGGRG